MDSYSLLLEKMPKDELEVKISQKINSLGGFITREAAANVLANELGLKKEDKLTLAQINDGSNNAIVIAKLERILNLQEFDSGKKMRKIVLSDASGDRELKLWNQDVEILNKMHVGDLVEIAGVYCKNNELSLGYRGDIKVVQHASFADLSSLSELDGSAVNVRGYVESLGEIKEFARDGQKRKMFSFTLSDGKNSARVVIWENADRGLGLPIGAEAKIENVKVKNGELHIGAFSRLMVKKKREGIGGEVEGLYIDGGRLILELNGEKYPFERTDALIILGARVADDILLETVLELKKDSFLGKEIFVEIKEGKVGKVVLKG